MALDFVCCNWVTIRLDFSHCEIRVVFSAMMDFEQSLFRFVCRAIREGKNGRARSWDWEVSKISSAAIFLSKISFASRSTDFAKEGLLVVYNNESFFLTSKTGFVIPITCFPRREGWRDIHSTHFTNQPRSQGLSSSRKVRDPGNEVAQQLHQPQISLRSKRSRASERNSGHAKAKSKKVEGSEWGGERRERLPANPLIDFEKRPLVFTVEFIYWLTTLSLS